VGSKIKIYAGKQLYFREHIPSRGFQSSMDYKQIIGIGGSTKIDSVVIQWPDMSVSSIVSPVVDSVYTIAKSSAKRVSTEPGSVPGFKLFDSVPAPFEKHIEDDYVDFYFERNIPEMLSREGPRAASADVDGDGLADIYIGGTKGHPGQLYTQTTKGFKKTDQKIFYQFADFEDGAALFFDADKDGDQDLFVGPAGNKEPSYSREMQCRLLLNDGKGNFSLHGSSFPKMGVNVAAAAVEDIDGDGDFDLFVGGRSISVNYGETPQSFMFINDGTGNFKDIAAANPALSKAGLITGAVFIDVNGDGKKELIVSGEWMSPKIFSYKGNQFEEVKSNLNALSGWWQRMASADLNGDGRIDLVLGNLGQNFYLHPTAEAPVKLWMTDFDGSGNVDKLLTRQVDGKDKPVFLKNDVQDQVPGIKKENLRHQDFAMRSIHDLFPAEIVKKAIVKEVNFCSSIIAYSKGNGDFEIVNMPVRAQLSSVNSILCTDVNGDGKLDLVTGGNKSGFPPQLQKLDASFGDVFINKGNNVFEWQQQRGDLHVEGEVRDIIELQTPASQYLLFLRNDDFPKMFKLNTTDKH
ncbi:MAG: CRTAC1 family protein, partial [Chitinophagaceae bacterium]